MRHRVDMTEYRGNGACGCENFEIKVRPHLERGAAPAVRLACYHLRKVREYSAVELWVGIAAEIEKNQEAQRARAREMERKRPHATHEDCAEVEAEAEGTLDYAPERPAPRQYQLKAAVPFATRPTESEKGPAGITGAGKAPASVPGGPAHVPPSPPPMRQMRGPRPPGRSPHPRPGGNSPAGLAALAGSMP